MHLAGQAILRNINLRVEHHGEDTALGVDVRLQLKAPAEALDEVDSGLKGFLYTVDNKLRMPILEPIKLKSEYENHALHLSDQTYEPVKFSKFEIEAEQDGIVQIAFNANISGFEPTDLPRLAQAMLEPGRVVNIDIEALQGELVLDA